MLLESHVSVLFISTFTLVLPLHYDYYLKESELIFSVYEDDDILLPANITMKLREDVWMFVTLCAIPPIAMPRIHISTCGDVCPIVIVETSRGAHSIPAPAKKLCIFLFSLLCLFLLSEYY